MSLAIQRISFVRSWRLFQSLFFLSLMYNKTRHATILYLSYILCMLLVLLLLLCLPYSFYFLQYIYVYIYKCFNKNSLYSAWWRAVHDGSRWAKGGPLTDVIFLQMNFYHPFSLYIYIYILLNSNYVYCIFFIFIYIYLCTRNDVVDFPPFGEVKYKTTFCWTFYWFKQLTPMM